jgi:hypothetical protein
MNLLKKLNLQRKGDENIGRLIVFAITIVIAIGVVSLVSYFYNQNRENAATTATVFSQTATVADFEKLELVVAAEAGAVDVSYSALDGVYTATFTGGTAVADAVADFAAGIAGVASVESSTSPTVTYKVKQ